MLKIEGIRSDYDENLADYSMQIDFDKSLVFADRMIADCVIQGVTLEYVYSHDCTFIPIGDGAEFWDAGPNWTYIIYRFKTNLNTLEDLAEHIRLLVPNIDAITIHAI